MLRRLVVVLVVLAAGCPRSREARTAGSAPPDLARATVDAALTCRTLPSCSDACSDGACAAACARRLAAAARPAYDALQACVKPACADADAAPCRSPGSLACKMCVLTHCAAQAATCMKN